MDIINRRLTLGEFRTYINGYDFGPQTPDKLVVHHTWKPTKATWQGQRSINGLKAYYERKNWPTGPHLFVAEDGIWLFSPMHHNGIHAGQLNDKSIGIEVVGDYDNEKWSGKTKTHALGVIKALMKQLNISDQGLFFHRDASAKSCPGRAITKEWLFHELQQLNLGPRIPTTPLMDAVRTHSVPFPDFPDASGNTVFVTVPGWAEEAVRFVNQHNLFQIKNDEDVRDAVKFHRLYQLINKDNA